MRQAIAVVTLAYIIVATSRPSSGNESVTSKDTYQPMSSPGHTKDNTAPHSNPPREKRVTHSDEDSNWENIDPRGADNGPLDPEKIAKILDEYLVNVDDRPDWLKIMQKKQAAEGPFWGNRGRRSDRVFAAPLNLEERYPLLFKRHNEEILPTWPSRGKKDASDVTKSNRSRREEEYDLFWGNRGRRNEEAGIFWGNRGKKDSVDPFWGTRGKKDDADPFWGNRGKKEDVDPFWGNRGKKEDVDPFWGNRGKKDEGGPFWGVRGKKSSHEPFWGNRGKKQDDGHFWGSRGKKDSDDQFWGSRGKKDDEQFWGSRGKKDNDEQFWGSRGKKDDDQFWGSRGKKDDDQFWGSRGKKDDDEQFWGSRGKKDDDDQFWGSRGKKDDDQFWGSRGKKDDDDQFWGSRGKKDDDQFWGSRGKKDDDEQFWGSRGKKDDDDHFWGSRGKKSAHLWELKIKKETGDPFWGNRGKRSTSWHPLLTDNDDSYYKYNGRAPVYNQGVHIKALKTKILNYIIKYGKLLNNIENGSEKNLFIKKLFFNLLNRHRNTNLLKLDMESNQSSPISNDLLTKQFDPESIFKDADLEIAAKPDRIKRDLMAILQGNELFKISKDKSTGKTQRKINKRSVTKEGSDSGLLDFETVLSPKIQNKEAFILNSPIVEEFGSNHLLDDATYNDGGIQSQNPNKLLWFIGNKSA